MWVIPELTEEFVRRMLDVLEVYERPYDPRRPQLCSDEKSVTLRSSARESLEAEEGKPLRKDSEYVRHGTANCFVTVEPKGGKRIVQTTKRRTAMDFAFHLLQISEAYPEADKIVVVLDNLNTHVKKSVIDAFGEKEGEWLWSRFEIHYTPPHGSWLDMAEIEIGILSRQCLKKRSFRSIGALRYHVAKWTAARNARGCKIDWQFTRAKAQEKFRFCSLQNL